MLNPASSEAMGIVNDGKIHFGERLAYACGDMSNNIVYGVMMSLLVYFYTNVIGVSIALVGSVLLVSRVFDGISDVVFGIIEDKVVGKYGKARSWILWMIIPFGFFEAFLYWIPKGSSNLVYGIYIFVAYNMMQTVAYTLISTAYGALIALMSRVQEERSKLSMLRMGLSQLMNLLVTSVTLPLVRWVSGGATVADQQSAWKIVTGVYAVIAMTLYFITFYFCKERFVVTSEENKTAPVLKSIKGVLTNKYWWIVLGAWGCSAITQTVIGVNQVYYCQYIFGNPELIAAFAPAQMIPTVLIILFILPFFVHKYGNRNCVLAGAIVSLVGQIMMAFAPHNFTWLVVCKVIIGIGGALGFGVAFAMLNDAVEYGQWKSHVRSEALTNSAAAMGSKIGIGLTGAVVGLLLANAGFDGQLATQPASALNMITAFYIYVPIGMGIIPLILYGIYDLDKRYPSIMKDLKERESRGEI
jgi:GPH family glycoside/pentoside/hexuronide:cation symporter